MEILYWQSTEFINIPHFLSERWLFQPWPLCTHPTCGTFDDTATRYSNTTSNSRFGPFSSIGSSKLSFALSIAFPRMSCSTQSQVRSAWAPGSRSHFCEPDGSYSDLIHTNHWNHKIPRIVVATRHTEWDFYFGALRKGAVTRSPWHATNVEIVLIHYGTNGNSASGSPGRLTDSSFRFHHPRLSLDNTCSTGTGASLVFR